MAPRVYAHESIPMGPSWDDVRRLLGTTEGDEPKHIRDLAILLLLSIYGFRNGEVINTIRAWLGHVSLATTNVYAEVDLEMKAKALAACEVKAPKRHKPWRGDVRAHGVPQVPVIGTVMWRSARCSKFQRPWL